MHAARIIGLMAWKLRFAREYARFVVCRFEALFTSDAFEDAVHVALVAAMCGAFGVSAFLFTIN